MTSTVAAGAPIGLAGGHEELLVRRGPRSGHTMIVAIHSTVRGPAAGGVRLWGYPSWQDGVDDALRLSEAMTHKCALADLPHGGAKSVLALPVGAALEPADRRALFLDLGDLVADLGGRYLAGEDVGTTATDLAVAAERTPDALCLPEEQGGIGEPSAPTAAGTHAALRAVAAHLNGEATLEGLRIGIHGSGQVGSRIAALAAADGAHLLVADIDRTRRAAAEALGARFLDPDDLLDQSLDLLVPASLGGVLTAEVARRLRSRAVVGPANNQLAAPEVADLLHQRGVLWAPDELVGAGGVTYALLRERHGADHDTAMGRVTGLATTLAGALRRADAEGTTPTEICARIVDERLGSAVSPLLSSGSGRER
jgi:glutamate dehydrogenase/leucine dehydrogenase